MKNKYLTVTLVVVAILYINKVKAQEGFGTSAPNPNSVIELSSTNKGLLLPRLALTSTTSFLPLSAHVAGMVVYNTFTSALIADNVTPGYYYNNGTKWNKIINENAGWNLQGNTPAVGDFFGTTSNFDIPVKVNNNLQYTIKEFGIDFNPLATSFDAVKPWYQLRMFDGATNNENGLYMYKDGSTQISSYEGNTGTINNFFTTIPGTTLGFPSGAYIQASDGASTQASIIATQFDKITISNNAPANFKGVEYGADYSANYSPLSLITKQDLTNASLNNWSTFGNTGTDANTNFLGTTDDIDLKLKVKNSPIAWFTNQTNPNAFAIFLGKDAGIGADNATYSNFIGYEAGYKAPDANNSNFIGSNAGHDAYKANNANFMGNEAGREASNANNAVFIGDQAGKLAQNASNAIFIGAKAGLNDNVDNSGGSTSILIGAYTSTGKYQNSIALGEGATNTSNNQLIIGGNPAIGTIGTFYDIVAPAYPYDRDDTGTFTPLNFLYTDKFGKILSSPSIQTDLRKVGSSNHITQDAGVGSNGTSAGTGSNNIAIGASALSSTVDGINSIAIGTNALKSSTTNGGKSNIAIGYSAMEFTTSEGNTAIGNMALYKNDVGSANTAIGLNALYTNKTSSSNTAIGVNALAQYTTGNNNTAIGANAGTAATDLNYTTAIGAGAQAATSNSMVLGGVLGQANAVSVGIGTNSPSNVLHVVATSNPLRLEGLQTGATSNNIVTVDANGVLTKTATALSAFDVTNDAFVNNSASTRVELSTKADGTTARTIGNQFAIQDDGRVGIGTNSATATLEVLSSVGSSARITNYGNPNDIYLRRAQGTVGGTAASNHILADGTILGRIIGSGYFSSYRDAASIAIETDGTPSATDLAGRILFSTTPLAATVPVERMRISKDGYVGIGTGAAVTSTALLNIAAGTTTNAPIKLTSGTNLTTPQAGALEYDGTNFFATNSTPTRYTLAKTVTNTATLDFASTAAQSSTDLTITVTGAADGDAVSLGVPNAAVNANSSYTAWVSAANTIKIRFNNYSSAAIDPASATFRVSIIKY